MTDTVSETIETSNRTVNRGGNPNWRRGVSGNPGGRPKGCDPRLALLKALARVEKEKGVTFAEHFCRIAFDADARMPTLAVALARKLWPDLTGETGVRGPITINIVYGAEKLAVQVFSPIPQSHDAAVRR